MAALYENLQLGVNDLDRIEIPKFQRGFVWPKRKKEEFVETLHKGYPFGAVLVYPQGQSPDSQLWLLDGQQRLSTIKEYKENPLTFWKHNNVADYEDVFHKVQEILKKVDSPYANKLRESDFDMVVNGAVDMADWAEEVVESDNDSRKHLRDLIKDIRKNVKQYVDLDNLKILAIKYIGNEKYIAEVFANLNKGGMPLSKYEIFSAAWRDVEIRLLTASESALQGEILDLVKDYYAEMSRNAEFELADFSEDDLTSSRSISLSEFCVALGGFVQRRLGSLISDSETSINEIGFGLLGIATGVDNRNLETLNDKAGFIRENLQAILDRAEMISHDLQNIFEKLLKRISAKKKNEYATGLTTTFKTLSYFASLWELDSHSSLYKESLKNIPGYYLYDAFSGAWSSHGDQRLADYYPELAQRDYRRPVEKLQFQEAFFRWLSDDVPGIRFTKDVQAIVTMHANLTYLSNTIPYGDPFELEHIVAKKRIDAADNLSSRKVYGSALGNCMYLPKSTNGAKKEKTLYEAGIADKYIDVIADSFYFSEKKFDEIFAALSNKDFDFVNKAIDDRGREVGIDLIDNLLK